MKIQLLNEAQAGKIYQEHMVVDFPADELKPFASIQQMMRQGIYEPLAFLDEEDHLLGYAWQTVLPGCGNALLGYRDPDPEGPGRPLRRPSGGVDHRV